MKIAFLDAGTLGPEMDFSPFKDLGNCIIYENTLQEEVIERLLDAEVAVTNKVKFTKEIIESCDKLKLICVTATGINNIDIEAAKQKGIAVKNVAAYSTDSVVQLTYALILSLRMKLEAYDSYIKSGQYSQAKMFTHYIGSFSEISGQQIGIIGMGAIGQKSAQIAKAFGAEVVYYSTSGKNTEAGYPSLTLNDLLKESDIVCIHAPLNENTLNLINKDNLCLMKKTALLINVGRGGIVNEADLADAIDKGQFAGAGIDVFSEEPIPSDHPFLKMKQPEKILLTPHIAWCSKEARERLMLATLTNIKDHFNLL